MNSFTGYPGSYLRVGPFRLDECPTYGCLFELTIQLAIIFVGKQILNDILELGKPYVIQCIIIIILERNSSFVNYYIPYKPFLISEGIL